MPGDELTLRESSIDDDAAPADELLRAAIAALHRVPSYENDRAATMNAIEQSSDEVLVRAAQLLDEERSDPMLRWSVVNVIGAINQPQTVEILHGQAIRYLGEYDPEGGCEQPVDVETLVAVMAAEGLGALAAAGNRGAFDALLDVLEQQREQPVREAAARAARDAAPHQDENAADRADYESILRDLRNATADDLTVDPDLADPDAKPERRFTGPKPPGPEEARRRQRPATPPTSES